MPLTPPQTPAPPRAAIVPRYQPVIEEVRQQMAAFLEARLHEMKAQVEPVLMEFADRAPNNRTQTAFFEAIRPLRLSWSRIEGRFKEEIERGFREFEEGRPITFPYEKKEGQEGLELMSADAFDQFLAVRNMADKCYTEVREEIFALKQRLAMVRGGTKLESRDVPGGPLHTASAFQIALVDLRLDPAPLMVLYALFAKLVLARAGEVYDLFNRRLIAAGIFPNLKFTVEKQALSEAVIKAAAKRAAEEAREEAGKSEEAEAEARRPPAVPGEELLASIRGMMLAQQRANPALANHPELHPGASMGQMADSATLVRTLAAVQPSRMASFLPQIWSDGPQAARIEVDDRQIDQQKAALAREKEEIFQRIDPNSVPLVDLHTIELVGMLFQRVLDEQGLPNIVKALLGHLHTTYLKVAILDRKFLSEPDHLARRLLDRMVEAGKRWVDENELRRGLYYPMQEVVDRLLGEFHDDLALFQEMHELLERKIHEIERRAAQIEEHSRSAQMGRERLESARRRAYRLLEQRVEGREIHSAMRLFIFQVWVDKLTFMLLRDPDAESKPELAEAIAIVDALIRIHDAREDPRIRTRLPEILPNLRRRIEAGLETLGDYHRPHAIALYALLNSYAEGDTQAKAAEVDLPPAITETAPVPSEEGVDLALVERLHELDFGVWFEIRRDDEAHPRRLKLSWFSPMSNRYMFVDGSGVAAMVLSVEELARKMGNGSARIVENEERPFVERALLAIRRTFEGAFGRPAAA